MSVAVLHPAPFHQPPAFYIWNAIQPQKALVPPSVVQRSLSQTSLQICTESLGSENGSDDFFSPLLDAAYADGEEAGREDETSSREGEEPEVLWARGPELLEGVKARLTSVNYHCSVRRRPNSYPPPLLSMCRRDGLCLYMRPHRRDGRLVVEAVPAPSQNYLHARRAHGRLLLSFIDAIEPQNRELGEKKEEIEAAEVAEEEEAEAEDQEEEEEEEDEEEEEVEVVDRGTIVEVKVATMKVLRSSLVINKFVGGELPPAEHEARALDGASSSAPRRAPATTATAAAAVVVTSTLIGAGAEACSEDGSNGGDGCHQVLDNKLLFTSKRRNRAELLRNMRRCSELRRPWFIWESCCIATSYQAA